MDPLLTSARRKKFPGTGPRATEMTAQSAMMYSRGPGLAVHDGSVTADRYIDGVIAVPDQSSHAGTPR